MSSGDRHRAISTVVRAVPALGTVSRVTADATPPPGSAMPPLPRTARPPQEYCYRIAHLDDHLRIREAASWRHAGIEYGSEVLITSAGREAITITSVARPRRPRTAIDESVATRAHLDSRGRLIIPMALRATRRWSAGMALVLASQPGVLLVFSTSILDTVLDENLTS